MFSGIRNFDKVALLILLQQKSPREASKQDEIKNIIN